MSSQPFLDQRAKGEWSNHPDKTWRDAYTDLCLDLAEGRTYRSTYAVGVRNLVATALLTRKDEKHGPKTPTNRRSNRTPQPPIWATIAALTEGADTIDGGDRSAFGYGTSIEALEPITTNQGITS